MAIIEDVKDVCDRLASRGWRDFLKAVTGGDLDILQSTGPKLLTALTSPLSTIDRTTAGFEDFSPGGRRAITAGKPAESLLYHALASPLVVRDHQGRPLGAFPHRRNWRPWKTLFSASRR